MTHRVRDRKALDVIERRRIALSFPGQGAEQPDMGLALATMEPGARHLITLASDATGVDIARAIERGGRALAATEVLQPALLAVSLAAARRLEALGLRPDIVLGHSLGELTAACVALDVDDETAISLARERGAAMARAARERPGGMIALSSITSPLPDGLALAAHNADDEFVVSGDDAALALLPRAGATRLRVTGAWHSAAMAPMLDRFREMLTLALAGRALHATFVSAVTASVVASSADAIDVLARGLVSPVRWVDTLRAVHAMGVTSLALAPPAKLSRSLARRTLGTAIELCALDTPADLDAFAAR